MLNLAVQADLNTACLQPLKSKRSKHRENYHRDYYLKNREKLLTYSRDYYGVKKLLAPYLKEKEREQTQREKKVLNNFFLSHTRDILTNSREKKERFFFGGNGVKKTKSNREEFERRLNQGYLRLATQAKRPLKRGWTYPNWQE